MTTLHFSFVLYLIGLLAIGAYGRRKTKSVDDYVIGSRQLGPSTTALSAGASDMSGWLLMGLPGAVLVSGASESLIFLGLVIGAWINWTFVAPRLRLASEKLDSSTISDFLAKQHDDHKLIKIVASSIIILFFTLYTSAGLVAGAKLFTTTLNIDYHFAFLLGVVVIAGYTSIGGFLAVCWSDVLQAILMVLALTTVAILAATSLGIERNVEDYSLNSLSVPSFGLMGTVSLLAWGLGYFGQPHILARFMAINSAERLTRARTISIVWVLICGIGAIAIGLIGHLHLDELEDPETVFIVLSQLVLHPVFAGIVIAAILAAIMSTVDSQLLIASTVLIQDCLGIKDTKTIGVRLTVIILAILASVLAIDPNNSVLDLVAYAWAGLGASFGPCLLMLLYNSRTTPAAIVWGITSGASIVVLWRNLNGGIFELYEIIPAFVISTLVISIVSRVTKRTN